jgi:uncharacterized protein
MISLPNPGSSRITFRIGEPFAQVMIQLEIQLNPVPMQRLLHIPLLCLPATLLSLPVHAEPRPGAIVNKKPTVVFITGDDEYRSREIMVPFAKKLEDDYGFNVIYLKDEARCAIGGREPTVLEGAERIKEADLMVLFVRFRSWEPESMKLFMEHFESGKPAVGIRTTTHAFWSDKKFSPTYFGGHYKNHPHHHVVCQLDPEHADHPIARGVDPKFAEPEGPYLATPLTDGATPVLLAYGSKPRPREDMIGDDSFDSPTTPVAWTFNHNGSRQTMFTLMSYRVNSQQQSYSQNLFYNSVFWALGYEVPEKGVLSAGKEIVIRKEGAPYQPASPEYPAPPKHDVPDGWTSLFSGDDLSQWKHYDYLTVEPTLQGLDHRAATIAPIDMSQAPARWIVENSAAVARVGYGDIITKKSYRNFRLHLDFLIPNEADWVENEWKGNSGIYLHGSHEICIHNSHGTQPGVRSNGAVYRQTAPLVEASRKAGEWQSYDITLKDGILTAALNGTTIHKDVPLGDRTPYGFPVKGSGPIRLQAECSAVRFANIRIQEIE